MLLSAVKSDFITGNASSMAGMGYLEEVANPCCDRCWMELSASSHSTGELALHSQYHAVSTDERIGEPRSAIMSACRWGGSRERYWSLSWLLPFSRIKRANPDSRHYQATLMSALMFTRVASMDRSIEASKLQAGHGSPVTNRARRSPASEPGTPRSRTESMWFRAARIFRTAGSPCPRKVDRNALDCA
ncbi:hypothetical protein AF71_00025990 [Rhizobium sp. 57MFTsu3.2]|nr:hypothetical protein [Rhizobium sp. 57MFTsu3.2]